MNEFFSNAVTSLNITIPDEYKSEEFAVSDDPIEEISKFVNHHSIRMINDNIVKGKFSFSAVSVADVEKEIKALDSKKASMSSSIPAKILKENRYIFSNPFTNIINNGISNSCFDGGQKLVDLTHIHQGDETTNKKKYRNVSLLPAIADLHLYRKVSEP